MYYILKTGNKNIIRKYDKIVIKPESAFDGTEKILNTKDNYTDAIFSAKVERLVLKRFIEKNNIS
jgi:hypothetical protein